MNIKATFEKIYANRKMQRKGIVRGQNDKKEMLDILSSNYQATIDFLQTATAEEIAIAAEVLCSLVERFPCREIVGIFKQKQIQYKKVNKICNVSYEDQIKEAEKVLSSLQRKMTLKEEFREILDARERGKLQDLELYTIAHGYDHETMRQLLCRNYEETIAFLCAANKEEIATAVEILDNLVTMFKSREIIEIFQEKGVEFPDVNDICEFDYFECIEEAESCLEEL